MLDLQELCAKMAANAAAIGTLTGGITPEQARWQPEMGKWSIVMVLAHLADEERDDFRRRLDLTLRSPQEPWPPIDPEGWARERDYNGRDHHAVLADFLAERERSLAWLMSLDDPQWSNAHHHPSGALSAGDLMVSWAAHDYLHLRQIVRLQFQWLTHHTVLYHTRYAGEW